MGIYNLCIFLASGIGPFVSTAIAETIHYRATFLVLFVLALLSLPIVILSKREQERESPAKSNNCSGEPLNLLILFKDAGILALSLTNIALAIISSLVGFFFIPFLKARGMDLIFTGSIVALYNIVSGIAQLPLGRISTLSLKNTNKKQGSSSGPIFNWVAVKGRFSDSYDTSTIVLISGIGTSAAILIFPLSHSFLLMTAAILLTAIGSSALLSATSTLSIVLGREKGMGSTMGFLSTSNSIGMILGCLFLSLMPGMGNNYEAFFYFSSAAVTLCTILFAILWFGRKQEAY